MSNHAHDAGRPLPMSVHNVGFLLDRLGQDCSPLQFLRELTQNGIEAIARTGQNGQIVWDVDWLLYDVADAPMRLCVIDNGDGMTAEELQRFINQLSSSGAEQTLASNYGVGAKISAATKNPAGVVYQSWKYGQGSMIQLEKNSDTGEYGLKQWELSDGSYAHVMPIEDDIKPVLIGEHGTKVVLFGETIDDKTIEPPAGAASPSMWISKYLNSRYFRFPDGLVIRAREGWNTSRNSGGRNFLRTLTGQQAYLDTHCDNSGVQKLDAAKVHWWILKDEKARSSNSGFVDSSGHVAALYQDELYDRSTGRAGTALLQQFGVLFGSQFVVLYVEPKVENRARLTTNTARTTLLLDGERLPWAELAYEFRNSMPSPVAHFVQEKALALAQKDHVESIRERLKDLMDLYRVSRYKPAQSGTSLADPENKVTISAVDNTIDETTENNASNGGRSGPDSGPLGDSERGNVYHIFEKKRGGERSQKEEALSFPTVQWVTAKDGTRAEDDMEDRAGKFLLPQNTLLMNADFRVYEDMINELIKRRGSGQVVDIRGFVTDVVRQWYEQALVETVIGVQQLMGSKEWGTGEVEKALSEEALTAAIMQRYHIFRACSKYLGDHLGRASR